MPYINYCSTVWSSASKSSLGTLQKVHEKALHLSEKPLLSFNNQLDFNKATLTFQILNNVSPSYLQNNLTLINSTHQYNTRSSSNNKIKTSLLTNSFSSQAVCRDLASVWNNLPNDLRKTYSILIFKSRLKKHLLSSN